MPAAKRVILFTVSILVLALLFNRFAETRKQSPQSRAAQNDSSSILQTGDVPFEIAYEQARNRFVIAEKSATKLANMLPRLSMCEIISVDGICLKGRNLEQANALLRGPVGSKVSIRASDLSQPFFTVVLERQLPVPTPIVKDYATKDYLKPFAELDQWPNDSVTERLREGGLWSAALESLYLEYVRLHDDERHIALLQELCHSIELFDRTGHFNLTAESVAALEQLLMNFHSINQHEVSTVEQSIFYLAETGRAHLASPICEALLSVLRAQPANGRTIYFRADDLPVEILERGLNVGEAMKVADASYVEITHSDDFSENSCQRSAKLFAARRRYDKSAVLYKRLVDRTRRTTTSEIAYDKRQSFVQQLVVLSSYQRKSGDAAGALATLNEARAVYDKQLLPGEQIEWERLPSFRPSLSDVELRIAEVQMDSGDFHGAKLMLESAVRRLEKALDSNSPCLKRPLQLLAKCDRKLGNDAAAKDLEERAGPLQDINYVSVPKSTLRLLVELSDDINLGKRGREIEPKIQELLDRFKSMSTARSNRAQNRYEVFASLIEIARQLKRNSLYEDADQLLTALNPIVSSGADCAYLMPALLLEQSADEKSKSMSADRVAMARNWIYKSAPVTSSLTQTKSQLLDATAYDANDVLRLIALNYAYTGEFWRAQCLFTNVIGQADCRPTCRCLAKLDVLIAKTLGDAADLSASAFEKITNDCPVLINAMPQRLQLALALANKGRLSDVVNVLLVAKNPEWIIRSLTTPQATVIAELLKFSKRLDDAYAFGSYAVHRQNGSQVNLYLKMLVAGLALDTKHFDDASKAYADLASPRRSGFENNPAEAELIREHLKNALRADDKSQQLDPKGRESLLEALATSLASTNSAESVQYYRQAISLVAPGTTERTRLLSQLASALDQAPPAVHIEALRSAAEGEKSSDLRNWEHWGRLAFAEAKNGDLDAAICDTEKQVDAYSRQAMPKLSSFSLVLSANQGSTIDMISKAGRRADAERLLERASEATAKLYGADSAALAASRLTLAGFYADEADWTKSRSKVTEFIEWVARHNQYDFRALPPFGLEQYIRNCFERITSGNFQLAATQIEQLISTERMQFGSDHELLADLLLDVAQVMQVQNKHLDESARYYAQGIAIEQLYSTADTYVCKYAQVLRKLGRNDEADRVAMFVLKPMDSFADAQQQVNALEQAHRYDYKERRATLEKMCAVYERTYDTLQKSTPYGGESVKILKELDRLYDESHEYWQQEKTLKALLNIYSKRLSASEHERIGILVHLARTAGKLGQRREALEFLKSAKLADSNFASGTSYLMRSYINAEIELKEKHMAEQDLKLWTTNKSDSDSLEERVSKLE